MAPLSLCAAQFLAQRRQRLPYMAVPWWGQTLRVLFEESSEAFVLPLAQKVRLERRLVGKRRLKPAGSRLRSD
jgi:hypothetical protein